MSLFSFLAFNKHLSASPILRIRRQVIFTQKFNFFEHRDLPSHARNLKFYFKFQSLLAHWIVDEILEQLFWCQYFRSLLGIFQEILIGDFFSFPGGFTCLLLISREPYDCWKCEILTKWVQTKETGCHRSVICDISLKAENEVWLTRSKTTSRK